MHSISKLKPDRDFNGLLLPFAVMAVAAFFGFIFNLKTAFIFLSLFYWIYGVYSFITFLYTGNRGFIIISLFQITAGTMSFLMPERIGGPRDPEIIFLLSLILLFYVWILILFFTKKIKWRGREILDLAAEPVEVIERGYTSRPFPAGKTEYTAKQIIQFAQFAKKNLIAIPYISTDAVVFVPVITNREFLYICGFKKNFIDDTWISFNFNGDVSVNISHRDYLIFNEEYSFEKLCESLGNLFIQFLDLYHRREDTRIIDRLNSANISPFS